MIQIFLFSASGCIFISCSEDSVHVIVYNVVSLVNGNKPTYSMTSIYMMVWHSCPLYIYSNVYYYAVFFRFPAAAMYHLVHGKGATDVKENMIVDNMHQKMLLRGKQGWWINPHWAPKSQKNDRRWSNCLVESNVISF